MVVETRLQKRRMADTAVTTDTSDGSPQQAGLSDTLELTETPATDTTASSSNTATSGPTVTDTTSAASSSTSIPTSSTDIRAMITEFKELAGHTSTMARLVKTQGIPAPKFDGSGDVGIFLESFEEISAHNQWKESEQTIRLKMSLTGTASKGVDGATLAEIKAKLRLQYEITSENALGLLKMLKMRTGDNVFQFGAQLKRLVRRAFPDMSPEAADTHATREFIAMLPVNSQAAWAFKIRSPANLDEALQQVHEFNGVSGTSKIQQLETESVQELCTKLTETMMSALKVTQEQLFQQQQHTTDAVQQQLAALRQQPRPNQLPKDFSQYRCYNCQELGHIARRCTKPSKRQSGNANVQEQIVPSHLNQNQ